MNSISAISADALLAHEAFILRLARGLTRDEASAQDLAQDARLSALGSAPAVRNLPGWLSRVMRNRAAECHRMEARRTTREVAVARPESHAAPVPLEQLELNHSVVQAVLALEEPFRGVVVAVYYEGLTPSAIAARDSVNAGTVRSRLARGLDQLKLKLDSQHGERSAWSMPLVFLCAPKAAQPAASAGAPPLLWPSLAGVSVLAVGGLLGLAMLSGTSDPGATAPSVSGSNATLITPASVLQKTSTMPASVALVTADPTGGLGRVLLAATSLADGSLPELTTVGSIRTRVRQLRTVILDRALAVNPLDLERFPSLLGNPRAGVTRILDRDAFGFDFSLPWMREGGSYFSFTEGVHDFNRRPQISNSGNILYTEGSDRVVVDLGPVTLDSIGATPIWQGEALSELDAARFAVAWGAVDPNVPHLKSLAVHARHQQDEALKGGAHTAEDYARWSAIRDFTLQPQVGHSYLVRARTERRFDVLVAFEVARVSGDGCTIAWRVLKTWPVDGARPLGKRKVERSDVPEPPVPMLGMTDVELRSELAAALNLANERLFLALPAHIEERYGALREQPRAGLARILSYGGPWAELCNGFDSGASITPLDGSYDGPNTSLGFMGPERHREGRSTLTLGNTGGPIGLIADVGKIDLKTLNRGNLAGLGGAAGNMALTFSLERFKHDPNGRSVERQRRNLWSKNSRAFRDKLRELGCSGGSAVVTAGRTYLVRSIQSGAHDLLMVVHVAAIDEYGAIVAWRVLEHELVDQ